MSGWPPDPALQWVLRIGLGTLFGFAAWHKLRAPEAFRAALRGYELLPERALGAITRVLPALELMAAAGFLLPGGARGAALLAVSLLLLYTGAVAVSLLRGRRDIDCGCAGPAAARTIGFDLVLRNVVLLVAAVACGFAPAARTLVTLDAVTIGAGAATTALLYAATESALANAHSLPRSRFGGGGRRPGEVPT